MDKKELVLQIEELEERIAPTVACGADHSGSGSGKSHKSHSHKSHSHKSHSHKSHSGSGKSDHSGGSAKCN
jgi:hypothetical protein